MAKQFSSTMEVNRTHNLLVLWRERNPGVYIGLSPEGSRIVLDHLFAYDEYMRIHSWLLENGKRCEILELLSDLPPREPTVILFKKRAPARDALSFY